MGAPIYKGGPAFFKPFIREGYLEGVTAQAGGAQAGAPVMSRGINRITTVATPGDSVQLLLSKIGVSVGVDITVINHGANPMQVFAQGTDTIDDIAGSIGVSQMPNSVVLYFQTLLGKWYSEGLSTGFSPSLGLQTLSFVDNLTAHAGGGQALGTPLTKLLNRVTTVATAADSVTLPLSTAGLQVTVFNGAAANSMNVFPAVGDAINALGANNAFAAAANTVTIFYCITAGQWFTK